MANEKEKPREACHHSWNGLFLEQMFSKGLARSTAENVELYFRDSDGEIKRVDTVGLVTDVEGNATGIIFKNDPKYGRATKKILIENQNEGKIDESNQKVDAKPRKTSRTPSKKTGVQPGDGSGQTAKRTASARRPRKTSEAK